MSDLICNLSNSAIISFRACSRRASSCLSRTTILRSMSFSFVSRAVSSAFAPVSFAFSRALFVSSSCERRSATVTSYALFCS